MHRRYARTIARLSAFAFPGKERRDIIPRVRCIDSYSDSFSSANGTSSKQARRVPPPPAAPTERTVLAVICIPPKKVGMRRPVPD